MYQSAVGWASAFGFAAQIINFLNHGPRGRVVKVADFSALDHSIISPMWVRASHGARIHM